MQDLFLIVDGNSLIHRAFHALPLMDYEGRCTNAVHGFLSMLLKCIQERAPRWCAVAFDVKGPTFRHLKYAEYKAGRPPMPPELAEQFDYVKEILSAMHLGVLGLQGYEADDILGTLSLRCARRGIHALLLTGDRDALQLVDDDVTLLLTRKGITEVEECTPARVKELFMVAPGQITDLKGLMGDSSDNIKGIPGVGEKTAVRLLETWGTVENLLEHAGEIPGKLGEKIRAGADSAVFSKWLATINREIPLEVHLEDCEITSFSGAVPTLKKYGLQSIIKRLPQDHQAEENTPGEETTETLPWQPLPDARALAALAAREACAVLVGEDTFTCAGEHEAYEATLTGQTSLLAAAAQEDPLEQALPLWKGRVVTHDGKRLLHQLRARGLPLPEVAEDTMLRAYVLNPQEKSYQLGAFAAPDAQGIRALARSQERALDALGVRNLYRTVELPLMQVLFRMEEEGFRVDTDALRSLGVRLSEREKELKEQIFALCGGEFNLNSPKQLGETLFDKMGLKAGRKTKLGWSTDADTLEALRGESPVIPLILDYRQVSKLNSTYIDALIRKVGLDGRIHTSFDQTGTATGRISSAEPNLQNIPVRTGMGREIRRAFVAAPGNVLVDADYSQIELRILAHLSGDERMCEAFRRGEDVHARTAAEVAGVPLDAVTAQMRSNAKAVNFGLVYGISEFGLARNTGMSRREAGDFIRRYFETYPGIQRYMREAVRLGYETGEARTLLGRVRRLPELKASNANVRAFGERAAMNTPVQGTAADIIKLAMVRVDEALRVQGLQSKLILQVHDELIVEAPAKEAHQVERLLRQCMEQVMELSVPLTVEVKRGASWYETK